MQQSSIADRWTEIIVTQQPASRRACDCPCHEGASIFHILPCCGSLLPRATTRIQPATDGAPEPVTGSAD